MLFYFFNIFHRRIIADANYLEVPRWILRITVHYKKIILKIAKCIRTWSLDVQNKTLTWWFWNISITWPIVILPGNTFIKRFYHTNNTHLNLRNLFSCWLIFNRYWFFAFLLHKTVSNFFWWPRLNGCRHLSCEQPFL